MTENSEKKDFCDAEDQKNIVEKMSDCDKTSASDTELTECYTKIIEEDEGCMSSWVFGIAADMNFQEFRTFFDGVSRQVKWHGR